MLSLADIWNKAQNQGKQEFLILPDRRYTYTQTCIAVRQICQLLDENGLKVGDRIAICSEDDFVVTTTFLACVLHGVVPINLAIETKSLRGEAILDNIDAELFICDSNISASWKVKCPIVTTARGCKKTFSDFVTRSVWPFDAPKPKGRDPRLSVDTKALAYLIFTSGSTSIPTGVEVSVKNLLTNLHTVGRVIQQVEGDRVFNDLPMGHTDGLIHGPILAFATQSTVVRGGGFSISSLENWLNIVRRESCTHFITVPFVWSLICRLGKFDDYFDSPEMKLLISSASKLDVSLWEEIESRFRKPLANEYGMTETVMAAFHAGPFDGMGTKGTIGLPAHCEAKIDPLHSNTENEGELLLKGDCISRGYWKNPDRNKISYTQDGWLRTGDIVSKDSSNNYQIKGRLKSIIVTGGTNVHPEEVNEILERHPDVLCSVTVGLSDKEYGEVVVSVIEGVDGIDSTNIIHFARQNLEPRKVPKRIFIIDKLPRGASGKPKLKNIRHYVKEQWSLSSGDASDNANMDVSHQLIQIAAEIFSCDIDDLSQRSQQNDVPGWDSFSQIELFLAIENEFCICLPSRQLTSARSLGDLIEITTKTINR